MNTAINDNGGVGPVDGSGNESTGTADSGLAGSGSEPTGAANSGLAGSGSEPMGAANSGSGNEPNLRDQIESALRTVFDPEIPVNIYDLGLVYEITIGDNGHIKILMTLTAPACPAAGDIVHDVQEKVEEVPGVLDCHVQLTFDPAWSKEMMTEEAKLELGFL